MRGTTTPAAGGKPPAVAVRADWVDWRERQDAPVWRATLWPNRSLGRRGLRTVMQIAFAGLAIPLVALSGTPVVWVLLPFALAVLAALWLGFRRNYRDGRLTETVEVWRDEMRVERREPAGRVQRWSADPWQVRVALHEDGKVENYLTLRGGGREIELGAFLAPEERTALAAEVEAALTKAIRA